jgi:hypothetical protein
MEFLRHGPGRAPRSTPRVIETIQLWAEHAGVPASPQCCSRATPSVASTRGPRRGSKAPAAWPCASDGESSARNQASSRPAILLPLLRTSFARAFLGARIRANIRDEDARIRRACTGEVRLSVPVRRQRDADATPSTMGATLGRAALCPQAPGLRKPCADAQVITRTGGRGVIRAPWRTSRAGGGHSARVAQRAAWAQPLACGTRGRTVRACTPRVMLR